MPIGCVVYENMTCIECQANYTLTNSGNCVPIAANCTDVDSEGMCTQC